MIRKEYQRKRKKINEGEKIGKKRIYTTRSEGSREGERRGLLMAQRR